MLLASTSDLDDLIPTLVAYQIEWNKLHALARDRAPGRRRARPADCAEAFGGAVDDWMRVRDAWDGSLSDFLDEVASRKLDLRIRMLSGSQVGYARMTRRWMAPIRAEMDAQGLSDRPIYFVSSNTHSLVNLVTDTARSREAEIVAHIEAHGPDYLRDELAALPRRPRRGLVGELPLLRRAALLRRQARGRARTGRSGWRPSARSA